MASGLFIDAINAVVSRITALGYVAVTDPRNARPLTVFVELPTFEAYTSNVADITIGLRVLGAPPGNQDATDYILTVADALYADPGLAIVRGVPSTAAIGSQELPAYDLTVRISSRRA